MEITPAFSNVKDKALRPFSGKSRHAAVFNHRTERGAAGIYQGGLGRYFDAFGNLSNVHSHVNLCLLIHLKRDPFTDGRLEALPLGADDILTHRKAGSREEAFLVALGAEDSIRADTRYRDAGSRDCGPARVGHRTGNGAPALLGKHGMDKMKDAASNIANPFWKTSSGNEVCA